MVEARAQETPAYETAYQEIIKEAQKKATELTSTLPSLPTEEEVSPFVGMMYARDKSMIAAARRHQEAWGEQAHGHGFEHLEWVAKNGAYVTAMECQQRDITGGLQEEIVQRAWRLGLLHDLQRWRGYGNDHMIEGAHAAHQLLRELDIHDEHLIDQVRIHDDVVIPARNNPRFDIPMFSVFAVDHLNWGLEWEKVRWEGLNKRNIDPQIAISDYSFMENMQQSPNFLQTKWGREVALPYLKYGITIAHHIESKFKDFHY